MEIKKGNDRLVVLIPSLQIALKFPRIYSRKAWKVIKGMLSSKRRFVWQLFETTVYSELSLKKWLFKGLVENWQEFWFYLKTRHQFCLPTYFSLFGFVNIQQLGVAPEINDRDLYYQISMPTHDKARGHHFESTANFSYRKGKWQILDYGDPRVQKVIIEFGNLLQEKFDINAKCPHNGVISGL